MARQGRGVRCWGFLVLMGNEMGGGLDEVGNEKEIEFVAFGWEFGV